MFKCLSVCVLMGNFTRNRDVLGSKYGVFLLFVRLFIVRLSRDVVR